MDEPLVLNLDTMTVLDYARLLAALQNDDHVGIVTILDAYVEGGLLNRQYCNFWLVIDQADAQIEALRTAVKNATAATAFLATIYSRRPPD